MATEEEPGSLQRNVAGRNAAQQWPEFTRNHRAAEVAARMTDDCAAFCADVIDERAGDEDATITAIPTLTSLGTS
ncbi:MAG TPA: hypothetical protein DCE44_01200 [Verrucomicrobiales bacterium]|nr:hypothetical protein [Verrucomicrobiales bacterium]